MWHSVWWYSVSNARAAVAVVIMTWKVSEPVSDNLSDGRPGGGKSDRRLCEKSPACLRPLPVKYPWHLHIYLPTSYLLGYMQLPTKALTFIIYLNVLKYT